MTAYRDPVMSLKLPTAAHAAHDCHQGGLKLTQASMHSGYLQEIAVASVADS